MRRRIVGLEIGADDYLPKPFSPRELLPAGPYCPAQGRGAASCCASGARDRLRRAIGGVRRGAAAHRLTRFALLVALPRTPAAVLSRELLMDS